jgi:hypothetical protein
MRYPLEWWGTGEDARFLLAIDFSGGKVYAAKLMLTTAGPRVALSAVAPREWNAWKKRRSKTDVEPEWFLTVTHSPALVAWFEEASG